MMISSHTQGKLAGLRSKAKTMFLIEGLSIALLALCGAILVTLGLDFLLRGPVLFRLAINVIALGVLGYCVYRYMVYPLMVRMSEDDMALCVEKGYPGLKDSLISSLQLSRKYDPNDTFNSSAMVRALIEQTEQITGRMNFGRVIGPSGTTFGHCAVAGILLLIVAGGFLFLPGTAQMFWDRIVMLRDTKYPEPWYLEIDNLDNVSYVPSHIDVMLEINVRHVSNPEEQFNSPLRIDYWTMENGHRRLKSADCTRDERQKNHYYVKLPRLTGDVEYVIKGYRVRDCEGKITVVERPAVLDIRCVVTPPDYTHRQPLLDSAVEDLNVLRGSAIDVRAKTSRPVSEAYIVFTRGKDVLKRIPLQYWESDPADHTKLKGLFYADESTTFKVIVQDEQFARDNRFTNLDPMEYALTIHNDEAPSIVMASPTRTNIKKLKNARVPVRADAKDDNYIQKVELLFQTFSAGEKTDREQHIGVKTLELYDVQKHRWTGGGDDPLVSYERQRQIENIWNVAALQLEEMGRISLKLRITDGFDLRGLPVAQDRLDRLASAIYNGQAALPDFWQRLKVPKDAQNRLTIMMYDGMIRQKKQEYESTGSEKSKAALDALVGQRNSLQIQILRSLVEILQNQKAASVDLVDISEMNARISKAYLDIAVLEGKSGEEIKDFESKFKETAEAFKIRVRDENIIRDRESSWAYIDNVLRKKAGDYYGYALDRKPPANTAPEDIKAGEFINLYSRFQTLTDPLREKREEIYAALQKSEPVDMLAYIQMVKDVALSGKGEFRDLRSLEELERRSLDALPEDAGDAFLLFAQICVKVEEEIAKQLQHIDLLQWRTGELLKQDFTETWDKLGLFDSFDLSALQVAVQSCRSDDQIKSSNLEDRRSTLSGEISALQTAIRKYCEEKGYPPEENGFVPQPKPEAPPAPDAAGGSALLPGPASPSFIQDEEAAEEGGEAPATPEGGEAAPGGPRPPEGGNVIENDEQLLAARYLGWEKTEQLKDLGGVEERLGIFRNIEEAVSESRQWVGPNFYETDVLQLNIVSELDKLQDLMAMLAALGKKILTVRDIETDDAVGALSRYLDLVKAIRDYRPGAAGSEDALLGIVKRLYPQEVDRYEKTFRNPENRVISVTALIAEIEKLKVRERTRAWASQKGIAEELPEAFKIANEILEEFIFNGFDKHEVVGDLTRTMPEPGTDSEGRGIIPTLQTLQMVLAPDLVRMTDDLQRDNNDDRILLEINNAVLPRQGRVVEECDHILKIIQKYQDLRVLIDKLRRIRDLQDAIRLAIELGGQEQ